MGECPCTSPLSCPPSTSRIFCRQPFSRCWSKPTRIGRWSIVDDGSTDATAAVGARFPRQAHPIDQTDEFRGISRSQCGHRSGLGWACGAAVAPDALLFLDGDDWLAPDALGLLAETLENAPGLPPRWDAMPGSTRMAVARLSRAPARGRLLERLLTRNLFANGGHLLIRREAIEAAGDFRSDLVYGEDWEYWTRLAALGEFVVCPIPYAFVVRAGTSRRRLSVQGDRSRRLSSCDGGDLPQSRHCRAPGDGPSGGPRGSGRKRRWRGRSDANCSGTGANEKGCRWLGRSFRNAPSSESSDADGPVLASVRTVPPLPDGNLSFFSDIATNGFCRLSPV